MSTLCEETPQVQDVPELIPARMLNEFSYCPRLAYLEWVQGEFADSIDTLEGRFGHRRVDRPDRQEVPEPTTQNGNGNGRPQPGCDEQAKADDESHPDERRATATPKPSRSTPVRSCSPPLSRV